MPCSVKMSHTIESTDRSKESRNGNQSSSYPSLKRKRSMMFTTGSFSLIAGGGSRNPILSKLSSRLLSREKFFALQTMRQWNNGSIEL